MREELLKMHDKIEELRGMISGIEEAVRRGLSDGAVSENEAARFLGRPVATLRTWRTRGGGPPYVKDGRAVTYRMEDLRDYLAARVVCHTTQADTR